MNKKLSIFFVYSYWIYIISILYFLDLFPYSPLFSNIIMIIFMPAIMLLNLKIKFSQKIIIFLVELSFLLLVLSKSDKIDYVFNYLLIMIYLCVLAINQKSLCQIYCKDLPYAFVNISKSFEKKFCFSEFLKYFKL